jgi:hypothetical protein
VSYKLGCARDLPAEFFYGCENPLIAIPDRFTTKGGESYGNSQPATK